MPDRVPYKNGKFPIIVKKSRIQFWEKYSTKQAVTTLQICYPFSYIPVFFPGLRGLQSILTLEWKSSMSCSAPFKLHGWNTVWNLELNCWRRRMELWAKLLSSVWGIKYKREDERTCFQCKCMSLQLSLKKVNLPDGKAQKSAGWQWSLVLLLFLTISSQSWNDWLSLFCQSAHPDHHILATIVHTISASIKVIIWFMILVFKKYIHLKEHFLISSLHEIPSAH